MSLGFAVDQYVSTKESWMADYCKEDEQAEAAKSEDWMGSSVDPPCFGQSKIFLCRCVLESLLIEQGFTEKLNWNHRSPGAR